MTLTISPEINFRAGEATYREWSDCLTHLRRFPLNQVIEIAFSPLGGKNGLWVFGQEWNGREQFSFLVKNALEPPQANLEIADTAPPVRVNLLP